MRTRIKVLLQSFVALCVVFIIVQLIDISIVFFIVGFLYELIIGNFLIVFNCGFNILRYSIPYLFIFFILCAFNLRYKNYIKWKFFGIDLQQYSSKINYLVFFFKEYHYWILFMFNFLFVILLFYYVMEKNFLIIGLIISFYIFIGLSIYIKRWLIKNNYYNQNFFNICLNMVLAAIIGLYLNEIGDSIEQYVGFKINIGEFLYGVVKQKDKLLLNLKHDTMMKNYKWWNLQDLYKNQKASLYFKNQILNQKFLTDITHKNKSEYLNNNIENIMNNVKNDYQIQEKTINSINLKNNNIYTDKNMVYYINEKFDNQAGLFKKLNLNYAKYLENKTLKLYLLNMKGFTSGDFVPKGSTNKFNLILLLDQEKTSAIENLNKVLLNKKTAKAFNYYLYLQNKSNNNQHHFFNILLDKNIKCNIKNLLFLKFTKNSVFNLIKENTILNNRNNKLDFNDKSIFFDKLKLSIQYIKINIKHNFNNYVYSYNHYLNWWEKKNYIINNFFKGYNVKKYASLTKYNFQGKNALFNLFKKDETVDVLKPIKIGEIHDVKFKLKLTNYVDRNLLYWKYSQTTFNNKIKLLNWVKILNNEYNMVKVIDKKVIFIGKQIQIYQPTYVESFLQGWVNWSESDFIKYIYLKYYPPQTTEFFNFKLKNSYSPLVIYSENYNNKYLVTLHSRIKPLNLTEYQKIYRSCSIYNYFLNRYINFDFNNKIDNLELKINNTKKLYSILFKNNSYNNYNNKQLFSDFKNTYVWRLNENLDAVTYKKYIIKIASNLDTSDNLYFKQFLFKKADILAFYFSYNKMSFGELLNTLKQWQIYFNKYSIWESVILKRKEYYNFNFKTLKNPYLDRSLYLKYQAEAISLEERLVLEKLKVLEEHQNRINICNLAYDTSILMENQDLDNVIDEIESILLFKGELKSCNKVASGLTHALKDLDGSSARSLKLIEQIIPVQLEDLEVQVLEAYKEIKDLEQQQRILKANYTEEELALLYENINDPEDKKEFAEILNYNEKEAKESIIDLLRQKYLGKKYIELEKAKNQLKILDMYCVGLEELLQDVIETRDADQAKLLENIENNKNLKILKEISLKRNIWLEDEYNNQLKQAKKAIKKLSNKDWDLYNQNRFKNEIITFKKKK